MHIYGTIFLCTIYTQKLTCIYTLKLCIRYACDWCAYNIHIGVHIICIYPISLNLTIAYHMHTKVHFFLYNQLAKYKQKTENHAFETHIHEIGLYYVMTSFEFIHHSGNRMSSWAHCIVGFSALGWGGMLHISANAVG